VLAAKEGKEEGKGGWEGKEERQDLAGLVLGRREPTLVVRLPIGRREGGKKMICTHGTDV